MSSTCAGLREIARVTLNDCRQLNREHVLKVKRQSLQDVVDLSRNISDAEVTLIGNKLKNKSVIVDDLALLKVAFIQSANNIVSFLKIKGALHALVRELTSNKTNIQLIAAECCCNLALGDPKSCLQVARAAGPYLISLMSGCNYSLINISLWTLGNLVGTDEKTYKVVHSQGFLAKLLQILENYNTTNAKNVLQTQEEIQQNAYKALLLFLHHGSSDLSEVEVESIVRTVADANLTSSAYNELWFCIFLLSSMDVGDIALIKKKVHLKSLEFLATTELDDTSIKSITPALRTVANLIAEPSGECCWNICSNIKLIEGIATNIFSSPYPHLVSELGWLLGNIVNHPSSQVQESLQEFGSYFDIFESQFASFSKQT